mgnify:CR=1 FL=1
MFEVKNLGKGLAKDVKVDSFDFDLVQDKYRDYVRERSFLTKGIPVLVPEANRNTVILDGPEIKTLIPLSRRCHSAIRGKGSLGLRPRSAAFRWTITRFAGPSTRRATCTN